MKRKKLTKQQKAALIGVSAAHYRAVSSHNAKPSYDLARKMAPLEGVHFLHLLDPDVYDERGKMRRTGGTCVSSPCGDTV